MNLQRREEIRVIAECPNDRHWAQEMRRAVAELLAHTDTLEQTAAERVIVRGAAVKPHTFGEFVNQVRDIANQYAGTEQLRERIAHALAPHFERDAGPTPDYTGEGSAWVPPVESGDIDLGEGAWISVSKYKICDHGHRKALWVSAEEVKMKMPGCVEAQAVVVPLGEGMVAVDREDLGILKRCFVILHRWGDYWLWANAENRQHWQSEKNEVLKMVYDRQIGSEALTQDAEHRNALRASQGGANE